MLYTAVEAKTLLNKTGKKSLSSLVRELNETEAEVKRQAELIWELKNQVRNGTSSEENWRGAQGWSNYDGGDSHKSLNPTDQIGAFRESAGGEGPSTELARMVIQCTKRMQTQLLPLGKFCGKNGESGLRFQDFTEEF
ncbi:unnamed protein product [Gongylonema pulchrum]|uniref:Vesicle transport protein SEC20 n=1 Tax=Gongylonema pulchrum TaxID=637853 RepID=A0A183DJ53_9BILA|nr:unnamed protein product [Gongylonema pulchrum]